MDQTTLITTAEEQLKNFGVFLKQNDKKLGSILKKQRQQLQQHHDTPFQLESLVQLDYTTKNEQLTIMQLLEMDNHINKVLLTFVDLCGQIDDVTDEAQHIETMFLYLDAELMILSDKETEEDEGVNQNNSYLLSTDQKNDTILLKMSESIEFLYQVQFLLQRFVLLGNNLLQQCGALISHEPKRRKNFPMNEMKLTYICDYLSKLFYHMVIFDTIISRSIFIRYWPLYRKTIDVLLCNNVAKKKCSRPDLLGLQNSLHELNFLLNGDCIFRDFLHGTFALKEKIGSHGIGLLTHHFNDYIRQQLKQMEKFAANELDDFKDVPALIKLNAFCVVFHEVCGQIDSKLFKNLLELNVKYHGIVITANIPWCATNFLRKNAFALIKPHEKYLIELKKQQQLFLNYHNVDMLKRTCHLYCSKIITWTLGLNSLFNVAPFELKIGQFKDIIALLLQGMQIIGKLSYLIKGIISAHESLEQPITKECLICVCKLLELLKMTQLNFQKRSGNIAKILPCIIQYLQYKLLCTLNGYKNKLISTKLGENGIEALAAIKIAERSLFGPASTKRLLVTKLCFDACHTRKRTLNSEEQRRFRLLLQRIEIMAQLQTHIKRICHVTFLQWHHSMLGAYLKQVMENKVQYNSFPFIFSISNETEIALKKYGLNHLQLNMILKKANYENLRFEIISKLCAQIETYLRLEVHNNLQVDNVNLDEANDFHEMINSSPLQIDSHYVIIKDHIENYISVMFYNLTTISLYDWKIYEEMRHLSNKRIMINPIDDYLPNQSLEQGIDILEIMRQINIFVGKYVYNMNSQIFVEQQSNNKYLDTIGIRHVANSIRTHGTGVISTTVNFVYQFLRQKFYTFSQFLYDEQINARLMKEVRSFAERSKADKRPLYPFERAETFNKDIRKLGLAKDGQTYMDLFRKVITHVGNALGYIRLVRSGSKHANYSTSLYLPKFKKNLQFFEECKKNNLSTVIINAAENLDNVIENLIQHFADDSTDFFKLLVEAFQPFFNNPNNTHLKSFFLIAPAVIVNYIEYILAAKGKINKKDHDKAILFDDGFAVGLAYILKLLDQITDFNSLQWFVTVRQRFDLERQKINEMLLGINNSLSNNLSTYNMNMTQKCDNDKLQQTLVLTERRINAHQMEYNLLFYNLCSAKIFFK